MSNLDESAARALDAVHALFASTDTARARFTDLREYLAATAERLETDWNVLRERAAHFQGQAANEAQMTVAEKAETQQSMTHLHGAASQLLDEIPPEVQTVQTGFETMSARVEALGTDTAAAIDEAEEAETALQAQVQEVEAELAAAMADAEQLLRTLATDDVQDFEQAVQAETLQVTNYLAEECLPSLYRKSQDLYHALIQADEDVRNALEAAAESCEESADTALRECSVNYDQGLDDLHRVGDSLEDLLKDLRNTIEDGRERLEDRKDTWDHHVRDTRESLRETIDKLKEAEDYLARFSFVK